jgi:UDP-N-acetylmuramoyl-tripeptide--D-alanyl-D-alanine ligase
MNAMTSRHPATIGWPEDPSDARGMALWTNDELAAATGGTVSAEFEVAGAEIDSREVVEGDLFFALKGEASDGHKFLEGAFARGAAAAVVDRAIAQPHVLVDDTFTALKALARASRARVADTAKIIGVTGSAGKTGVKEALFAALDRGSRGRAHRSLKSYNNHVGVPLSLARMPSRTQFGVFEMGMNHSGELSQLTQLVRPHVAIITTIAPAHIGFFKDETEIADAKGEIFEGLETSDGSWGGVAIIPADNPHYARLRAKAELHAARVVPFGLAAHAEVRLIDAVAAPDGGTLVTAQLGERRLCYTISHPGAHWVLNSLAVMAAVMAVGGDLGAAGLALAEMEGLTGRGARHTVFATGGDGSGTALVIDESYNANPASMRVTIASLGATRAQRRIAVLGAMKELGADSDRYHAELADPIITAGIDQLILVGEEMGPLAEALASASGKSASKLAAPIVVSHVKDAGTAIARLGDEGIAGGDALLVKGSNSVGLGALVRALTAREA